MGPCCRRPRELRTPTADVGTARRSGPCLRNESTSSARLRSVTSRMACKKSVRRSAIPGFLWRKGRPGRTSLSRRRHSSPRALVGVVAGSPDRFSYGLRPPLPSGSGTSTVTSVCTEGSGTRTRRTRCIGQGGRRLAIPASSAFRGHLRRWRQSEPTAAVPFH